MLPALLGLALLSGQRPSAVEPTLPVSVERIRSELTRPNRLRLASPDRIANFTVEIVERERFRGLVEQLDVRSPVAPGGLYAFEQRRQLGGPWSSQPSVRIDALPALGASMRAAGERRRTRADAAARKGVKEVP